MASHYYLLSQPAMRTLPVSQVSIHFTLPLIHCALTLIQPEGLLLNMPSSHLLKVVGPALMPQIFMFGCGFVGGLKGGNCCLVVKSNVTYIRCLPNLNLNLASIYSLP